jgi:hypothetical protein
MMQTEDARDTELANSALIDHEGQTFLLTIEQDRDSRPPGMRSMPEATSPDRCAEWERGEWHYVRVRIAALDPATGNKVVSQCEQVMPSDGDLSAAAMSLCASMIDEANQDNRTGVHFRVRENAVPPVLPLSCLELLK